MPVLTVTVLWVLILFPITLRAQSPGGAAPRVETRKKSKESFSHLVRAEKVEVASEVANSFDDPIECDGEGNFYLQSEQHGVSGIRKLNSKGERVAVFQPTAAADMKIDLVGYFALGQSGELYQLVFTHELTRYVFVYKADGSYKSAIKLQPGFAWQPSAIAVFPSGNLLVSGLGYGSDRKSKVMLPFTGIFSQDGTLLKEIKLEDDDGLHDMAASGDPRVSSPVNPQANHAVDFSQMEAAADGNIYLMRWLTPAIFYAISPGGEVVRRFTVDPGDADLRPTEMHIAGNRIAVLFFHPQTMATRMKIVDLEGREIATYDENDDAKSEAGGLGTAFACYTANPERFAFLSTGDNQRIEFLFAEPR